MAAAATATAGYVQQPFKQQAPFVQTHQTNRALPLNDLDAREQTRRQQLASSRLRQERTGEIGLCFNLHHQDRRAQRSSSSSSSTGSGDGAPTRTTPSQTSNSRHSTRRGSLSSARSFSCVRVRAESQQPLTRDSSNSKKSIASPLQSMVTSRTRQPWKSSTSALSCCVALSGPQARESPRRRLLSAASLLQLNTTHDQGEPANQQVANQQRASSLAFEALKSSHHHLKSSITSKSTLNLSAHGKKISNNSSGSPAASRRSLASSTRQQNKPTGGLLGGGTAARAALLVTASKRAPSSLSANQLLACRPRQQAQQQVASSPVAVTNSRLRQGTLFARRQLHLALPASAQTPLGQSSSEVKKTLSRPNVAVAATLPHLTRRAGFSESRRKADQPEANQSQRQPLATTRLTRAARRTSSATTTATTTRIHTICNPRTNANTKALAYARALSSTQTCQTPERVNTLFVFDSRPISSDSRRPTTTASQTRKKLSLTSSSSSLSLEDIGGGKSVKRPRQQSGINLATKTHTSTTSKATLTSPPPLPSIGRRRWSSLESSNHDEDEDGASSPSCSSSSNLSTSSSSYLAAACSTLDYLAGAAGATGGASAKRALFNQEAAAQVHQHSRRSRRSSSPPALPGVVALAQQPEPQEQSQQLQRHFPASAHNTRPRQPTECELCAKNKQTADDLEPESIGNHHENNHLIFDGHPQTDSHIHIHHTTAANTSFPQGQKPKINAFEKNRNQHRGSSASDIDTLGHCLVVKQPTATLNSSSCSLLLEDAWLIGGNATQTTKVPIDKQEVCSRSHLDIGEQQQQGQLVHMILAEQNKTPDQVGGDENHLLSCSNDYSNETSAISNSDSSSKNSSSTFNELLSTTSPTDEMMISMANKQTDNNNLTRENQDEEFRAVKKIATSDTDKPDDTSTPTKHNNPASSAVTRSQPLGLLQSINIDQQSQELYTDNTKTDDKPQEKSHDNKQPKATQETLTTPTTIGGGENEALEHREEICNDIAISQEPIGEHYDIEARPFARGKFAQVKRCVKRDTNECFAAKCIKKRRRLIDIKHEILLEIEALKLSYQTKYIVKLYEVYETPNEMILILELAKGGELQRVLDDEEAIDEALVRKMIKQILEGLIYLHDNQIAHLDIKPQNLLLTEPFPNGDIKLCDFGISRRITNDCIRDICGTPEYCAPEVLDYNPISLATDMWSLGVLTYVLLSGYSPFGSENKQQTFCNITSCALDFPAEIFDKTSASAIDFIRKLIVLKPSLRLTSRQARSHHWISQ